MPFDTTSDPPRRHKERRGHQVIDPGDYGLLEFSLDPRDYDVDVTEAEIDDIPPGILHASVAVGPPARG